MDEQETVDVTAGKPPAGGADAGGGAGAAQNTDLLSEFARLRAELEGYRSERAAREAEQQRQRQEELLRKGQLDDIAKNHAAALKAKDDALAAIDKRARSAELRRSLAEALSGHDLREGASAQLLKLWGDEFEVHDDGDGFKVRSRSDLREPKAVFAERLKSPEFDHFLRAGHRGGSGAGSDQSRGQSAVQQPPANPFAAAAATLKAKFGQTVG